MSDSKVLTEKERARLLRLVANEWGYSEEKIIEWINDDDSPTWAGDPWSKVEPL